MPQTKHKVFRLKDSVLVALIAAGAIVGAISPVRADAVHGLLETIRRHVTETSTVTNNGDLNPYAVVVAPASVGKILKDDVLVDNFNNVSNLQGTGTTIVDYNPATKRTTVFAKLPQNLAACPGGVGLTTAMAVLKSGWVIVGSTPSTDGTTRTRGAGCLIVLDANGQLVTTWSGPQVNGPWGNMAVIDNGSTATLFISMAGFDVPGPQVLDPATGYPVTINKSTVVRLQLAIADSKPPSVTDETVVANGLPARADRDVFLIGPTGLALIGDTLYVSDALDNQIVAIPNAMTRKNSAGMGRVVTKDGLLKRPLALALTRDNHLLVCNAKNGQLVEIDPTSGQQLYAQWIDTNQAQSPPGNGDLFGIAMTPDGEGFYYVEDDMNSLVQAER